MKVRDRILVITDLLLGALYADATMTGEEDRAVRELLGKLLICPPDALPPHVDERIRSFSLMTFDIELAAKDFLSDPPMKKRRLLELIASLTDKDGTDLREDEYIRDLAQCLGMKDEELAGVVLDYEIESLRQTFESIRITAQIWGDNQETTGVQPTDPEADLPRWRRKALKQRRESQRRLEAAAAAAAAASATGAHPAVSAMSQPHPSGPKSAPPPIPAAARRKKSS
jgi:uncharacterized tellurite resistance protein B-like protein